MSDIIDNMMYKSRQEQQTKPQELDLNRLLQTELQFLEADINFKHNIAKVYDFSEPLPKIKGIYGDFSQSLLNIIKNAIDAMYKTPKKILVVETKYDEEFVYVKISDSGCGIKKENLLRIFDPFFTTKPLLGEGKNDEPTGTGLGLSSAYQLLKKYDAKILVESQVGIGSTFTVKIPRKQQNV
jgi:signal transduction histidine kinase